MDYVKRRWSVYWDILMFGMLKESSSFVSKSIPRFLQVVNIFPFEKAVVSADPVVSSKYLILLLYIIYTCKGRRIVRKLVLVRTAEIRVNLLNYKRSGPRDLFDVPKGGLPLDI